MEWDEGAGETAQDWSRKMVYFSLIMKMISMYLGITLFLFEMKLLTKKKLSLILIYYQKKNYLTIFCLIKQQKIWKTFYVKTKGT